jgi:hypothetical protein
MVFRWLAFPWLQAEIDDWVRFKNETSPRKDKNKILPHGIPALIRAKPQHYGGLDFKVVLLSSDPHAGLNKDLQIPVPSELLDKVEAQFAPPDDPVFQLVPPLFDQRAREHYLKIGQPIVSSDTLWTIFRQLLQQFQADEEDVELMDSLVTHKDLQVGLHDEKMELLPNMKPFRNGAGIMGPKGSHYAGGLANPPGGTVIAGFSEDGAEDGAVAQPEYAIFTDSEDSSDE